ncbi:MAG: hypothetical protein F6K50_29550 [Moorea sp. SIO3I7]|nr:hypothetical protein [Moorena sp. SIO3I7]
MVFCKKKDNKQWIWLAIDGRWPRYANKKLKKLLDFILEIVVENQQRNYGSLSLQ